MKYFHYLNKVIQILHWQSFDHLQQPTLWPLLKYCIIRTQVVKLKFFLLNFILPKKILLHLLFSTNFKKGPYISKLKFLYILVSEVKFYQTKEMKKLLILPFKYTFQGLRFLPPTHLFLSTQFLNDPNRYDYRGCFRRSYNPPEPQK